MPCLSFHKRRAIFFAILFLTAFAFTGDVLDLREELRFLSYPYSYLDNNVATGIVSCNPPGAAPCFIVSAVVGGSSIAVSFLSLLTYGYRAPPPRCAPA